MGNAVYKQKHKRLGLCCSCSRKAVEGFNTCIIHKESARLQSAARTVKRKKEGRCTHCGIKLHPEMDKNRLCCTSCSSRQIFSTTSIPYATTF